MSSRALRKAQREKEEQDRLKKLEQEARALGEEEEEDEDDIAPAPTTKKSAFELLQDADDSDNTGEDQSDEDEDEPSLLTPHTPTVTTSSTPQTSTKNKRKRRKRGKKPGDGGVSVKGILAKEAREQETKQDDMDEIDRALQQLATNGNNATTAATTAGVDPRVEEANRLLSIDTQHLHAVNEMRRLFGRAALEQDHADDAPAPARGGNRRQQRQQVGLRDALRGQRQDGRSGGLAAMALRRNIFIQGKEDWPQATGGGLGMEVEEKRADGTVLYRFVHNTAYQDVQSQFETCVASMDPQRMILLLQHNPYHISTLLQVSEIAKQDRDHSTSGDLLERALFSFGRAVHSTFSKSLAEGKARLDFRRPENREFWLASWRYIQNLTMRATWRTVYEWAKMLLSLSPEDDPYGIWLVLDQYALRSRQDLDYLNVSRNPIFKAVHDSMPNVQFSQALAECRAGNKSKGQQLLFSATGKYPWMVSRLMHELNVDAPPAVWGKEPGSETEKLYAELYGTRAKDLWNTPENSNLLIETASAVPPEAAAAPTDHAEITRNVARHVLLSDAPAAIALVPRYFTNQLESSSDPLPPEDNLQSYELRRAQPRTPIPNHVLRHFANHPQLQQMIADVQDQPQTEVLHYLQEIFPWFDTLVRTGETGDDVPANEEELLQQVRDSEFDEDEFRVEVDLYLALQDRSSGEPDPNRDILHRLLTNPVIMPGVPAEGRAGLMQTLRESGLGALLGFGGGRRANQARVEDGDSEEEG